MSWKLKPNDVCKGAEINYKCFVDDIKRENPSVTAAYYKKMVAKCILFNTIDSIVKSKKLGGYKSNMNAYILSSISMLSKGNLDLMYIWNNQLVQQEIIDLIEELIPLVWTHLTATSNGATANINEWSKRAECWNRLKLKVAEFEELDSSLMQEEINEDGSCLNETQLSRISEAEKISANTWFEIAKWAKANNQLTPMDRKAAFNFGALRSKNLKFKSLKQALYALNIMARAKEEGFKG